MGAPSWVDELYASGGILSDEAAEQIRASRKEAFPWLVRIIEDEERLARERPAARHAQAFAAVLLAELGAASALPSLIGAFVHVDRSSGGARATARKQIERAIVSVASEAAPLVLSRLERTATDDEKCALAQLLLTLSMVTGQKELLARCLAVHAELSDVEARDRLAHAFAWSGQDTFIEVVVEYVARNAAERASLLFRVNLTEKLREQGLDIVASAVSNLPLATTGRDAFNQRPPLQSLLQALHELHAKSELEKPHCCMGVLAGRFGPSFVDDLRRWSLVVYAEHVDHVLPGWSPTTPLEA